jgi:hypothetical protein
LQRCRTVDGLRVDLCSGFEQGDHGARASSRPVVQGRPAVVIGCTDGCSSGKQELDYLCALWVEKVSRLVDSLHERGPATATWGIHVGPLRYEPY